MKPIRSLVLCFLLLCSLSSGAREGAPSGKDFTGHWEGVLHVTVDGKATLFPFVLDISAPWGGEYYGDDMLGVTFDDGQQVYIKCTITGSVSGNAFVFKDKQVTSQTLPKGIAFNWCVKSGRLHFTTGPKGEDVLEGPVNGSSPDGNCLPATAELRRKNK